MKIEFWVIGKTDKSYLDEGIAIYQKRLKRYLPFEIQVLPDVKGGGKMTPEKLKEAEGKMVINRLKTNDLLILLDEKGKAYTSTQFATQIEKWLSQHHNRLIFLVGGAFGFSPNVYNKANGKLALSNMTFSHQMIRVFFLEQLYRGMTILKNEPYHNA